MTTTFTVEVDWAHDGTWVDETARTQRVQIHSGFEAPGDHVAGVGRCRITLDNTDGRFSPGNRAGVLYRQLLAGRAVRVSASAGAQTWVLFRGLIAAIMPQTGPDGHTALLDCIDVIPVLARGPVSVAHSASKSVAEAVGAIVAAVCTPPGTAYADNGDTLEHYGRAWQPEHTSALEALNAIAEAVYGRCYVARDGTLTFMTRSQLLDPSTAPVLTIGDPVIWAYHLRMREMHSADLVAYWPLWEASGTTAADLIAGAGAATYDGGELGAAGVGDGATALFCDGLNDRVILPAAGLSVLWDGSEGTLLLWARAEAGASTGRTLARLFADANNSLIVQSTASGGAGLSASYTAGGVTRTIDVSAALDDGWHAIAVTWSQSGDVFKLYLDGAQVGATQTGLGTWSGDLTAAYLGSSGASAYWQGWLAHAAIWRAPLLAADVAALATV